MQIVFAHQSFPAQFGAFGAWLARRGWGVTFLTADRTDATLPGCTVVHTPAPGPRLDDLQLIARPYEIAMLNARAFGTAAQRLRKEHGLVPDIVMSHAGAGVGSFCKAVWPGAVFVPYIEWFYRYPHVDMSGDEKPMAPEDGVMLAQSRNVPTLLDLAIGDAAFCPTEFQAAQFPEHLRSRLTVMHDGVDCTRIAPDPLARMDFAGLSLPRGAEVVTYATRGMELHRGFPQFMRALEQLQQQRPNLHAVIGGEDRVAYGAQRKDGRGWKDIMLEECNLDPARTHFTGPLGRGDFLRLMQASDLHIYFTVPFVLSWSLIEAMAAGCTLLASDVAPVREALRDGHSADLVDHDDTDAVVAAAQNLLDNRGHAQTLATHARETALARYDSNWLWPARANWLEKLVDTRKARSQP